MVKSCRAYVGTENTFDTDHRMIMMDIAFPKSKHGLWTHLNKSRSPTVKPVIDVQALRKDEDLRRKFTERLDAALDDVTINEVAQDMDELNERITTTV